MQSVDAPSAGHLRLSRRDRGAAGPAARGQRRRDLRQSASSPRPKAAPRASSPRPRPISEQTILDAKGQTARYNQIYAQYKNAPGVTRERMYLETMERVLGGDEQDDPRRQPAASPPVPYMALDPLQPKTGGSRRNEKSRSAASRSSIAVVAAIVVAELHVLHRRSDRTGAGAAVRPAGARPHRRRRVSTSRCPFIDSVVYIDKRILALDNERQEVLVAENQRLEVDAFVRYRIADPLRFYQSVSTSRAPTRSSAAC